ncbi:repressor of the inhibitor of the protein kinase, partial [Araneus ventricosus]
MTSSPFKNLLERNEKEKVDLEEAKVNRALKNNKNGDKTKKGKALKSKKKLILNSIENPVPSTSLANNTALHENRSRHHFCKFL